MIDSCITTEQYEIGLLRFDFSVLVSAFLFFLLVSEQVGTTETKHAHFSRVVITERVQILPTEFGAALDATGVSHDVFARREMHVFHMC